MAKNVTIAGQDYSAVPSVQIPLTGGGTASFVDVTATTATADKILSGYGAYSANGTWMNGTATNSGGSVNLVEKTVTPTTSQQVVGLDALNITINSNQQRSSKVPYFNLHTIDSRIADANYIKLNGSIKFATYGNVANYYITYVFNNAVADLTLENGQTQTTVYPSPAATVASSSSQHPDVTGVYIFRTFYSSSSKSCIIYGDYDNTDLYIDWFVAAIDLTVTWSDDSSFPNVDGLSSVTVNAIPSNYIVPTGTKSITANGTNIDVASYQYATVAVPFSTITVSSSNPSGGNNGDIWIKTSS